MPQKDGHSVISISEEETAYLQELNASHNSLAQNKRNLQIVESEIASLNAAKNTAIKDIEAFIKLAHEKLEQRQNDLMKQVMIQFNAQQNTLLGIQKQIQEDIERLNENINQARNITKDGDISKLKPIFETLKGVIKKLNQFLQDWIWARTIWALIQYKDVVLPV